MQESLILRFKGIDIYFKNGQGNRERQGPLNHRCRRHRFGALYRGAVWLCERSSQTRPDG
jgi:hypothetical protein